MNTSDITKLATERRNPRSRDIDRLTTAEMVSLINSEDKKVADAVEKVCPQIAAAIDLIYARMKRGGRLIYCGCGTSGRLGILDASECPPTYSVPPETVQAVIAGGRGAVFNAVEGAEDSAELGKEDMLKLALTENDTLVGIAASGRTPYVLGAMKAARDAGAGVIGLDLLPRLCR
ncbi:MAG: N-acetylmuramic acid 6-phosphate etherase [Oscillospiraceae bacterium]